MNTNDVMNMYDVGVFLPIYMHTARHMPFNFVHIYRIQIVQPYSKVFSTFEIFRKMFKNSCELPSFLLFVEWSMLKSKMTDAFPD